VAAGAQIGLDHRHGIGLTVRRGSIVSLIGSNGAGKTTILRSLSGLMKVDGGFVAEQHPAGPGLHQARQAAQDRGLAGTVRAA
jgi:ABC-type branched-subunit amino acid transport system ATPase component